MLTIWILCAIFCLIVFSSAHRIEITIGKTLIFDNDLFFSILLLLGIILLMCANRTGYDADAFARFYRVTVATGRNPYDYTYELLARIVLLFSGIIPGLTYPEFHALIIVIIWICLLIPSIKYYSKSVSCVLSLYVLSGVFASDGMQMKGFIAVAFLIAGLCFLFQNTKKSLLIYILFITIAVGFHFSFALYYVFVFLKSNRFKNVVTLFPWIGGLLYAFMFLGGSQLIGVFINGISRVVSVLEKASIYSSSSAGIRSIEPVGIYFIVLFVLYYFTNGSNYEIQGQLSEKTKELLWNVQSLWQLMGLFLPLLYLANALYRLYRNLYIIIFIVSVNLVLELIPGAKQRWMNTLLIFCFAMLIFLYPILLGQSVDIYRPVRDGLFFWQEGGYRT